MSPAARAAPLILFSAAVVLLSTTANAGSFNITLILERSPQLSQFNELLTRTKLADEINRRLTITVLALNNDNIGGLSGKPEDVLKRILSNHVILDYYDEMKLSKLKDNKTVLTTLYQASGTADERQGFLKVEGKNGGIYFGSDVKGAPADSRYLASVAARPYNVSVLSVSQPIIAPGIDGSLPPSKAPTSAPPPPKAATPAPSTTTSQAPTPSTTTTQAPTPDAASPPPAETPSADASSPPPANAAGKISGMSLGFVVAIASLLAAH